MPTDIVTAGEVVKEESAKPQFSLDKALDWLRDPANEPKIREWSKRTEEAVKSVVSSVDKQVTATGRLLKEALEEPETADSIVDDLLSRFGFKPDDD